ncbi:MAG TPA: radical SAM family heme chaperone HemW [Gemmatimonadales bacterium]
MHLYVHVPFCARRCSYCDFAIAVRRQVPSDAFGRAIGAEWALLQDHPAWSGSPVVETIYFGGGTPSRIEPRAIGQIIELVRRDRPVAADAEITLEANPDDVTPAAAEAWRAAGVNRVSLGVQSFDPAVLAWMHRTHRAEQVAPAIDALREAGIADLSLDLIFALPPDLDRDWRRDLDAAMALDPTHLSLYGLTVESHTPLARWTDRGAVRPVPEDRYAAEFLEAAEALRLGGWDHYEVSNAARPGRRAVHNSAYWHRAPYLGLGPSAHSAYGARREWNLREWEAYRRALEAGATPRAGGEDLDAGALRLEELYLGLRTTVGVAASAIEPRIASAWVTAGWAHVGEGRLRLTPEGWLRLDALVAQAA